MTVARETVMDALLAYLQAQCTTTFRTYTRRFITWERMVLSRQNNQPLIPQPALLLYDGMGLGGGSDDFAPRGRGTPGVETMTRTIVIYAQLPGGGTPGGPDDTTPGGTVFHPLMESVRDAMALSDSASQGTLTLSGLVSHCWLEGQGLMMTGELDEGQGQGMLTLPVKIMLYPNAK